MNSNPGTASRRSALTGDARQGDPEPAVAGSPAGIQAALAVIGDRWSLLIVSHLLQGPHRFSALLRLTPGLSANILTKRLRRLEVEGIVEHRAVSSSVDVSLYALSRSGWELQGTVSALERWSRSRG